MLEWKGLSGEKLPQGFVETQVTALSRGVVGTITVARMLRRLGWEIKVPTPEEDVKGTDLKGEKGGQLVELQIKCRESSNLHVGKSGDKIFVVIPGRTSFFDDHELGIPEHRNFKEFESRFNSLVARRPRRFSKTAGEPPLRRRRSSATTNEESPSLHAGGGFNNQLKKGSK